MYFAITKKQSSRDSQIINSFFINVIDIAVFEIYFPEIFENYHLNVLDELRKLTPFNEEQVKNYYQSLNNLQSPVRKAVYDITNIPEFKLIYQILANENKTYSD